MLLEYIFYLLSRINNGVTILTKPSKLLFELDVQGAQNIRMLLQLSLAQCLANIVDVN